MVIAYIGLGGNLDQPEQHLRDAHQSLSQHPDIQILAESSLYVSRAMTLPDDTEAQPDYINAVVMIETRLDVYALLDVLRSLEERHGRQRQRVWGSRTLDLDILLYGNECINNDRLSVPHPGIAQRSFVLLPLADIDSDLQIPGQGRVHELLARITTDDIEYLGSF